MIEPRPDERAENIVARNRGLFWSLTTTTGAASTPAALRSRRADCTGSSLSRAGSLTPATSMTSAKARMLLTSSTNSSRALGPSMREEFGTGNRGGRTSTTLRKPNGTHPSLLQRAGGTRPWARSRELFDYRGPEALGRPPRPGCLPVGVDGNPDHSAEVPAGYFQGPGGAPGLEVPVD